MREGRLDGRAAHVQFPHQHHPAAKHGRLEAEGDGVKSF